MFQCLVVSVLKIVMHKCSRSVTTYVVLVLSLQTYNCRISQTKACGYFDHYMTSFLLFMLFYFGPKLCLNNFLLLYTFLCMRIIMEIDRITLILLLAACINYKNQMFSMTHWQLTLAILKYAAHVAMTKITQKKATSKIIHEKNTFCR